MTSALWDAVVSVAHYAFTAAWVLMLCAGVYKVGGWGVHLIESAANWFFDRILPKPPGE